MSTKDGYKQKIDASDETWEQLKVGVENTWSVLQSTLEDAVATFKD